MIPAALVSLFLASVAVVFVLARLASLLRRPPYVPLPPAAVESAVMALELSAGDRLVGLGSGDGRILLSAARRAPGVFCRGLERGLWPLVESWLRWHLAGRPANVRTVRQDFFRADVSSYDKVFAYLFPQTLDALLPKLERELTPGALLVSADYQFSEKRPERVIELGSAGRGRTLFIYRF